MDTVAGNTSTMLSMPTPTTPTDLSAFKMSSPPGGGTKTPDRSDSVSPASSPPSLPPSSISMVSMASMLTRPPSFGFPGVPFPQGFPPKDFPRLPGGDYPNLHNIMPSRPYVRSPPPMVSPNDPTANDCKIVDYRGEKIAAFMINNKTMLCLPQAFELFLKNLVGGLHTVYTKCKRLEIIPMICNVEQVRVLRGLGAIQPGVNRCKLIADTDFDTLYKDCTTSRPPKRVMPFPAMSPQDAMLRLSHPGLHPPQAEPFNPFPIKENGMDRFGGGMPPHPMGAAHLMSLNSPAAQAALLSRSAVLPGLGNLPLPGSSPQVLLETYKQNYGDMIKHLQGLHKTSEKEEDIKEDVVDTDNSALNLSRSQSDIQEDVSLRSESDIGEVDATSDDDLEDPEVKRDEESLEEDVGSRGGEDPAKEGVPPGLKGAMEGGGKMGNMFQMMNHIQSLINMAVENAKNEETGSNGDVKGLAGDRDAQNAIKKKIDEESKTSDFYLKRFRKEKRLRKRLQDQLELETRKIQKLEAALRSLSYDTLIKVKESIARDAAQREKEKLNKSAADTKNTAESAFAKDKSVGDAASGQLFGSKDSPIQNSAMAAIAASSSPLTSSADYHSLNYSVALERPPNQQQPPPAMFPGQIPSSLAPHSVSSSY